MGRSQPLTDRCRSSGRKHRAEQEMGPEDTGTSHLSAIQAAYRAASRAPDIVIWPEAANPDVA